jgi:hypothetical protein
MRDGVISSGPIFLALVAALSGGAFTPPPRKASVETWKEDRLLSSPLATRVLVALTPPDEIPLTERS